MVRPRKACHDAAHSAPAAEDDEQQEGAATPVERLLDPEITAYDELADHFSTLKASGRSASSDGVAECPEGSSRWKRPCNTS